MKLQPSTTIAGCHRGEGDYTRHDEFKVTVTLKADSAPQTIAKSNKIENGANNTSGKRPKPVAPQKSEVNPQN
jgi:hypothetical protein